MKRMSQLRAVGLFLAVMGIAIPCSRIAMAQNGTEATDKRIFQEIREHNKLMKNLEYLSDEIGPRLTGSDQLQRSVDWASGLAGRSGLQRVHVGPWKPAHSTRRDSPQGRLLKLFTRRLPMA